MSDRSAIEWTDATWNPVTGCTKVSAGCKHCYAERFAERFRGVKGHPYEHGFDVRLHEDRLAVPLRWTRPRRIFVNSMSDLFHEDVPLDFVDRVFETMAARDRHTFQVLTKRTARMRLYQRLSAKRRAWPEHVWAGTSIEDERVMFRADLLRTTVAPVRFLSLEPLLGPLPGLNLGGIGWVIVGGESGPHARPMDPGWVRKIRDQCVAAGVPFFFKQWGGTNKKAAGRTLDGRTWDEFPKVAP